MDVAAKSLIMTKKGLKRGGKKKKKWKETEDIMGREAETRKFEEKQAEGIEEKEIEKQEEIQEIEEKFLQEVVIQETSHGGRLQSQGLCLVSQGSRQSSEWTLNELKNFKNTLQLQSRETITVQPRETFQSEGIVQPTETNILSRDSHYIDIPTVPSSTLTVADLTATNNVTAVPSSPVLPTSNTSNTSSRITNTSKHMQWPSFRRIASALVNSDAWFLRHYKLVKIEENYLDLL